MDPLTLSMMLAGMAGQQGLQQLTGQPSAAPQVTAQVPQSQPAAAAPTENPFNQQRGQQMVNGLGPLVPPVMSKEQLDAMEKSIESPSKKQVTDSAEVPGFGQKLGKAATSPEALAAMMSLALAPQSNPAPSVAPMNTTSSFQGGGMNPYQMLAQRRR